ncbi:MAG: SAM-dependent methyltransferase [Zoogloeaceae bacterium]|jgi:16S rRNA (cytidine1402-2'-O)-methyltransferase|nr:SAM-dependent methyltransferase [Zoogloeaceae bacterium]
MSALGATLYLLPMPLGLPDEGGEMAAALPATALARARDLRHFVVENAKTARVFLKQMEFPCSLRELVLNELNEHTPASALPGLLSPLDAGWDLGLMSEAGCPAVADPGSALVALARRRGFRVTPLVGPSSILLALMASGLEGQRFAFLGYLPAKPAERALAIRALETESAKKRQTQIFIETPYRNLALFESLLRHAAPSSRLCVATALTLPEECVETRAIEDWRRMPPPEFARRPSVFLLAAEV